jgi:hypothetical protein
MLGSAIQSVDATSAACKSLVQIAFMTRCKAGTEYGHAVSIVRLRTVGSVYLIRYQYPALPRTSEVENIIDPIGEDTTVSTSECIMSQIFPVSHASKCTRYVILRLDSFFGRLSHHLKQFVL